MKAKPKIENVARAIWEARRYRMLAIGMHPEAWKEWSLESDQVRESVRTEAEAAIKEVMRQIDAPIGS